MGAVVVEDELAKRRQQKNRPTERFNPVTERFYSRAEVKDLLVSTKIPEDSIQAILEALDFDGPQAV